MKKPRQAGFFHATPVKRPGVRPKITWQQMRQKQVRKQAQQQKRQQQVLERVQQQALEQLEQRLLLFCRKQTKQQQR
jgi:hypothetical protein